jgi:hypothetical protein
MAADVTIIAKSGLAYRATDIADEYGVSKVFPESGT